MKFILEISCDNAAFQPDGVESQHGASDEVARILRDVAKHLEREGCARPRLTDSNGNCVGGCKFSNDPLSCGF